MRVEPVAKTVFAAAPPFTVSDPAVRVKVWLAMTPMATSSTVELAVPSLTDTAKVRVSSAPASVGSAAVEEKVTPSSACW